MLAALALLCAPAAVLAKPSPPAAVPQRAADEAALRIDAGVARDIERTLRECYAARSGDPPHISNDLVQLARYYARYPAVVRLFRRLTGHPWRLVYRHNTWSTRVVGSRLRVHNARVDFDLRSGAQLAFRRRCRGSGLCRVSPADALLHELLHVDSMFNDTPRFLADGGLTGVLPAHVHEWRIIRAENRLYRAMTRVDGHPRPQRWHHRGRLTLVDCVTCID